ncbi:MAG: KdsC family phosphatase [Desulfobacca sp.]|uniref:KdsC family phosphatase n=1 Tax=Desulfobacca sp. TaxID=2067990 RepID=UPI00404A0A65
MLTKRDLPPAIRQRAAQIRLVVLDVDGVLTDGQIIYTDAGTEIKCFHVRDGHGIRMLQQAGIEVALITGRHSQAVAHRAQNLQIRYVFQGVREKVAILQTLQADLGISPAATAVVGDDLVDLGMMQQAGLAVAVADAPPEVQARAHWVTTQPGGRGAVRELAEAILKAQGRWEELLCHYVAS